MGILNRVQDDNKSMKTLNLYKLIGLTPLQCIEQFRAKHPEYNSVKLGYAGRLDPMAEGLLLVLVGDENKKKHSYEGLDKEYEFEILFGVATDSYDVLGIIRDDRNVEIGHNLSLQNNVKNILPLFVGTFTQHYPPYSSARVKSKPLFYWAREGKLDEISMPTKEVKIYELTYSNFRTISKKEFKQTVFDRIHMVQGEFRQEEIKQNWEGYFEKTSLEEYLVIKCLLKCSSGTYVRALVNEISKKLKVPALTFSIKRTKVGEYSVENSVKI
jgi:tRNA pseudouridine55 synthase